MVKTRSTRPSEGVESDDDDMFLDPGAALRQQQVVHGLVQHSIRSDGLQQALSDLDKAPATRPLAETIRLAITECNRNDASEVKALQGVLECALRMLAEANAARDRVRMALEARVAQPLPEL